jgi:hypothetical protein
MPIGLGIGIGISISGSGGVSGTPEPRIQLSGLSIAEDAVGDTEIGTASVANAPEGVTYTWAITSDPDSKFAIDETTGVLTLATLATLDYETATSHQVTIEATPDVGDPIEREFTITVTNVLEVTLNALSLDADELTENSAEDTAVGAVQDKTSGSTLTLIDTAGGRFKLSGTNIVAGATPSDYEVATSYEITLRETHPDASNSPRDTVIEVTILDDPDDTDTVPDAFEAGDWSIAAGDEEADVTISSLPADGGDTITDIEYRLDGGSWVSSGGTSSFTISGLTNDQEYDVELRAVNSVGAGAASDTKQVTPEAEDAGDPISVLGAKMKVWIDFNDPDHLWTNTSGTTPAGSTDAVARSDDKSGNGHHATQSTGGNRPVRSTSGGCTFDGVNDLLAIADHADLKPTAAMSIYCWFHPSSPTRGMYDKDNGTGYSVYAGSGVLQHFQTTSGGTFDRAISWTVDTWQSHAWTFNGTIFRCYRDAVEVASQSITASLTHGTQALNIGQGDGAAYAGRIGSFILCDQALTVDEIEALDAYFAAEYA